MGEEELVQCELVSIDEADKKEEVDVGKILEKLLVFFDSDIDEVIKYIMLGEIEVAHITPGKRIDLHPSREYLLRLSRVIGDIKRQLDNLNNEDEDLDNLWG